jgi:hypothetical protein
MRPMAHIDRRSRIVCKACGERPIWHGRECGLCGAERIVKSRRKPPTLEQQARIDALFAELMEQARIKLTAEAA